MRIRISVAICALSFLVNSVSFAAQDITFEATVDKNIAALGEGVQLSLTFEGATDAAAPQITEPEGFSAKYLGPSTMMSIVNGRMSSSISHIYVLIPLKTGKFKLGPFYAEYNGQTYSSQKIEVEVVTQLKEAKKPPSPSAAFLYSQDEGVSAEEQLKDRIFVEMDIGKRDVYLNEIIPVTVRLYVNRLAIRDIEYPLLAADGFSKSQFEQPKQYQKSLAGLIYDVIEFKTTAYALKAGTLTLGPAEIKCNLVVRRQAKRSGRGSVFDDFFGDDNFFSDFFNRFQTYPLDLKSPEISVNVKPVPAENRPADYSGAVGEFDMQVEVDALKVKAGDPITLKMRISGSGNFVTVNPPVLEDTKDFKVYQPQARLPSDALGGQAKMQDGEKVFEQVIIPLSENVKRISAVSFSFFDPKAQAYETIKRGPIAIEVSKPEQSEQVGRPKLVEALPAAGGLPLIVLPEREEVLGKDIIYIKDNPGTIRAKGQFLYRNKSFILFLFLPLAAFLVLFFIERRNQRLRTDVRYARLQKAYKKARKGLTKAAGLSGTERQEEFYSTVFKTVQEYIGDRLHVPSGGITASSAEQHLRQKAVPEEMLQKLNKIFETCDTARFAPISVAKSEMPEVLRLAREVVEELERVKL